MINFISTHGATLNFRGIVQYSDKDEMTDIRIVGRESGKGCLIFDMFLSQIAPKLLKPNMTDGEIIHAFGVVVHNTMSKWTAELLTKINWEQH